MHGEHLKSLVHAFQIHLMLDNFIIMLVQIIIMISKCMVSI